MTFVPVELIIGSGPKGSLGWYPAIPSNDGRFSRLPLLPCCRMPGALHKASARKRLQGGNRMRQYK
jgi:hypothetical protein